MRRGEIARPALEERALLVHDLLVNPQLGLIEESGGAEVTHEVFDLQVHPVDVIFDVPLGMHAQTANLAPETLVLFVLQLEVLLEQAPERELEVAILALERSLLFSRLPNLRRSARDF